MSHTNIDQLLDQIVIALRQEPVPELPQPLPTLAGGLACEVRPESLVRPGADPRRTRRRWWAAGAALAALVIWAIASPTIVPLARPNAAFAEVQKAVSAFKSVRYRVLDFQGKKDPYVTTTVVARGVGWHSEASNGSEQIANLKARRMLWLDHRARKATFYQLYVDDGGDPVDSLQQKLRNLPAHAKPLGEAELDGKKVLQFEFMDCGRFVVAADPETKLPIRMEFASDAAQSGGAEFREVITDFVFDAAVNESLFELSVPAGYAIERYEEPPNRKPIDAKSLVVSPARGIGAVRLGASKDRVIQAFGRPDLIKLEGRSAGAAPSPGQPAAGSQPPVTLEKFYYYSLGFELSVSSAAGVTQIRCLELGSLARPFAGKTDAGIALGASIDDVIRAYGTPERRSGIRDDVLDYFHQGWSFVFYDGKLAWFTASEPMSDEIEIEVHDDGSYTQRVRPKKQPK